MHALVPLAAAAALKATNLGGPDPWARAYAAGRKISIDALLREIDDVLPGRVAGV